MIKWLLILLKKIQCLKWADFSGRSATLALDIGCSSYGRKGQPHGQPACELLLDGKLILEEKSQNSGSEVLVRNSPAVREVTQWAGWQEQGLVQQPGTRGGASRRCSDNILGGVLYYDKQVQGCWHVAREKEKRTNYITYRLTTHDTSCDILLSTRPWRQIISKRGTWSGLLYRACLHREAGQGNNDHVFEIESCETSWTKFDVMLWLIFVWTSWSSSSFLGVGLARLGKNDVIRAWRCCSMSKAARARRTRINHWQRCAGRLRKIFSTDPLQ
jgi:hypothetical protein